jgi:hypothetical protein
MNKDNLEIRMWKDFWKAWDKTKNDWQGKSFFTTRAQAESFIGKLK